MDEQNGLDEGILRKLMRDKQADLVRNHNNVHDMLGRMCVAAELLDVQPRLQVHELTNQSIAIAMNTLAKTATASVIAAGVLSLERFRADPHGAAKAADFVAKHRQKHPSVPNAFWQLFEDIASYSSPMLAMGHGTSSDAPPHDGPAQAKEEHEQVRAGSKRASVASSGATGVAASASHAAQAVGEPSGTPTLKRRKR